MCGIIAVLRRPPNRTAPSPDELLARVHEAGRLLGGAPESPGSLAAVLRDAAWQLDGVNRDLAGLPGVHALLGHPDLPPRLATHVGACEAMVATLEDRLDTGTLALAGKELEEVNAAAVLLKDATWAILRDRLPNAAAVAALAGPHPTPAAIATFTSVQTALSALDRLEVRGRDSAGLHLLVTGHGLTAVDQDRLADPFFTSTAVRNPSGALSFVYKAAAEIGELGDNTRALRRAITEDALLHRAVAATTAQTTVLGHTRWASVGIISETNAHPLNSDEPGRNGPYVVAALNGDVDNYAELRDREGLRIPPEFTTDAKVIPTLVSRRLEACEDVTDAFRQTVAEFDGSVAIAASAPDQPDHLLLALRGSGQALYIGLAEDAFLVASEPYGIVEETTAYVRMDGETTHGQVVALDGSQAGTADGITRLAYDGTPLPLTDGDVQRAEITTRDIDRAGYPHFLLKEINEAPQSFRKTLRGKVVERDGLLSVSLGDETLPPAVRARLDGGSIRRVFVIGQGTAAVAGQSVAAALLDALGPATPIRVHALPATELSGFGLDDDMSDALVIAISQSGTTTDTNRTVDLVRARGAAVIGIVNRRNSDLVEKADGVLYTSDGRDVEMSVASTKAFYAQIAAGTLLALAIARPEPRYAHDLLTALRRLPAAMDTILAGQREAIAAAARLAPSRRYWAVVGNGPNRIAASEIRIKLSELCYKSIACDATEDKKHIDLSSEPLILVCASGLDDATAGDVAKEVAIYRAHKAAPVVIASEGDEHFDAALACITVPAVHPQLAFVLSAMAGHLFGYETAMAIDGQARLFREARAVIEDLADADADPDHQLARLRDEMQPSAARIFGALRSGELNGHMEASTAERVASLLRYTAGIVPLEAYQVEYGKVGTPNVVVADLTAALTTAIEELTRPIDAIKHQAKTVTVGISRSEEALFRVPAVEAVLSSGVPRDRLTYRALRTLAALDPSILEVTGYTRYRVDGATVTVVDQGGVARGIPSRTAQNPELRGTKHRAAYEREVTVARGRSDGRTVVIVPEVKDNEITGLSLLHVRFADHLPAADVRAVLIGYRNRYAALVDAVTETEPRFDDDRLATVPLIDLLVEPVHVLADRWHS
ncbi:MAG TPA: SIS domain-containing protein [Acidimicrobiales bacterium]|nr:SIS domain-containing protein [Acidimicrobiales bacterium]